MNGQRQGFDRLAWVTTILAAVLALVDLVLLLQIGYHVVERRQTAEKVLAVPPAEFRELRDAQQAKLQQPLQWVDREHGLVRLPIEQAMALVVRRGGGERR